MVVSFSAANANSEDPPPNKRRNPAALSSSSSSSLSVLPDEIPLNILARVPRCYYPVISLVSRTFRRLIASRELYVERSVLRRTENVLYVVLRSHSTEIPRWYSLNFKPIRTGMGINRRLVPIPSFPQVPCWGMSIVTVGFEIYVLGGFINDELVSTGFVIECPSHTRRNLPSMKQARGCAAAGFIDGKIYVIGGCDSLSSNWVEAFDLKTQTWESVSGVNNDAGLHKLTIRSFVVDDKFYIMDRNTSFIYDPKEGSLERDALVNLKWRLCSCAIDDRLYTIGEKGEILFFDPIATEWKRLMGPEDLPEQQDGSRMVNNGGKLAILYRRGSTELWCTEIGLEKRDGGEVWGTILWSNLVLTWEDSSIIRCVAVTV